MVMCLLHLEGFAESLAARIPTELPFDWLLTAPQEWIGVFKALKSYYENHNDSRGFRLLQLDIASKKEQMLLLQPGLKFVLQLAYHFGFGLSDREVNLYKSMTDFVLNSWLDKQFDGEHSELQSLLRRVNQDEWPHELNEVTKKFVTSQCGQVVRARISFPHDDPRVTTIALPFLVAADVVAGRSRNWQSEASRLFALRQYREFDPVWFDSAYLVGLAHAYRELLPK
jgi:hypothetical protein